ncbi:MAG: hypothetical protein CMH52_11780 [Myxococcales bacterium]|nr:hypothetical protein [Myxococcales bacterium]
MRFNTTMMLTMFTAFGSGCIEAPEAVQWTGNGRSDGSVINQIDAQNEPDNEVDSTVHDMDPVPADAFVTDGGIDLDSGLPDGPPDAFVTDGGLELDSGLPDGPPDAFVTDGGIDLDSGLPDGPPDAVCTPSDEVCDGLDNNCNGEIDEDNVCLCERNMDPLFYICMVAVDWQQARMACAAAGNGLAVIETVEQNQLALALIGESPAPPSAWIGLNDIDTEGRYLWHDMNPVQYRSWREGMPDNSGEEDCVELQAGGWNDLSCDAPRPFICRDIGQN